MDARLLLPAGAAWACAASALLACSLRPALAVPVMVVAALLAITVVVARAPMRMRVALLAGAFGLLLAGAHAQMRHAEPLERLVTEHAVVRLQATVSGDPVVHTSVNAPVWMPAISTTIGIHAIAIESGAMRTAISAPMELRLSASQVPPPVGALISVRARLAPAPWNRDLSAYASQSGLLELTGEPNAVNRLANGMRAGLRESTSGLAPDTASLITGLAVGDVSQQPADLDDAMRVSGLTHLTAVSGGNVAIVIAAVLLITSRLRLRRRARVVIALGALVFFIILVRPQPSVIRAAVMCSLTLLGMLTGGKRAGPAVLCASVLILIGLEPGLTVSWGFALSVGATAGLILISPRVQYYLSRAPLSRRWPPALREAVAIAASAQIATLPVLIAMGAGLGVMSIPANLLAIPAVAPVTILGLLASLTAGFAMPVAWVLSHLAAPFAWWIAHVAYAISALPMSQMSWPAGLPGLALLTIVGIGLVQARPLMRRRWPHGIPTSITLPVIALCCVLISALIIAPPGRRGWPPADWRMVMCDVGQGDATVLRDAQGSVMVIDAGQDPAAMDACLRDLGISSISVVLLTHFHADHVRGLSGVLKGRSIGQVWLTSIEEPVDQAAFVHHTLEQARIIPRVSRVDESGAIGTIAWRVLWPRQRLSAGSVPNNASVVLLIDVDGLRLLLTGDVEPEAQAAIIHENPSMAVDIAKVPHHGSRYQDPRLPAWSHARLALISVGDANTYGHPAPETIAAWQQAGALVARTDIGGDLAVIGSPNPGLVTRGG